jgi:hypothetical protein
VCACVPQTKENTLFGIHVYINKGIRDGNIIILYHPQNNLPASSQTPK